MTTSLTDDLCQNSTKQKGRNMTERRPHNRSNEPDYPVYEKHEEDLSITHRGNANRFLKRHKEVKYIEDMGQWLKFNGHYWKSDQAENYVRLKAQETVKSIFNEANNGVSTFLRTDFLQDPWIIFHLLKFSGSTVSDR